MDLGALLLAFSAYSLHRFKDCDLHQMFKPWDRLEATLVLEVMG